MTSPCATCGAPLQAAAGFCGRCGAQAPAPAEDAQAVARYEAVLARFVADGGLDERERQQLEALRERLGLAAATHDRLVAALAVGPAAAPAALRLSIDEAPIRHFEAQARCVLRLRVENRGELALERLELRCEVRGEQASPAATSATLFPGQAEVLSVWLVPKVAGYQELCGSIAAVDLAGARTGYRFGEVQFRVGSGGDAPRIQLVHVDQRSARVVDNSRSTFGAEAAVGGLVAEGAWREVPLSPVAVAEPPRAAPAAGAPGGGAGAPGGGAGAPGPVDFEVRGERGAYRVGSTLARGDLATVYGGERRGGGGRVAVKVVDDRRDNDLIQAEVRALELLRAEPSPQAKHLPLVLDQLRTADGRLGTVFEQLDGLDLVSLRERLPEGVPPRHLIWILRRALSVLGWAHKNGVVHGNVEPAHVMVRPRDHNVWLIDWCYAAVQPARTGQGYRFVNEEYSPPEVAERRPPLPSADLYALGKTIIYAAGGDPRAKTLPEAIDERLRRFVQFFVRESPLGRAQDAWELYKQLDLLREEIYGPHAFLELKV